MATNTVQSDETGDLKLSFMLTGGLDKLELRIPAETRPSPSFYSVYESNLRNRGIPDRFYREVHDLRSVGLPARLHAVSRFDIQRHSKLEFIGVSGLDASEMDATVRRVYDCDPKLLQVMHIDLFADVKGLSVHWFRKNATVKHKRTDRSIGTVIDKKLAASGLTLHIGNAPNGFRVYDKTAERLKRLEKELRGSNAMYTFSERFGYCPTEVVTRVERQINGNRKMPASFSTLGGLFATAPDFDPFANLVLFDSGVSEPELENYPLMTFLAGMGLRQEIEVRGITEVKTLLNRKSQGNAARILKRLADFIPHQNETLAVPDLTRLYQCGVRKQLQGIHVRNSKIHLVG